MNESVNPLTNSELAGKLDRVAIRRSRRNVLSSCTPFALSIYVCNKVSTSEGLMDLRSPRMFLAGWGGSLLGTYGYLAWTGPKEALMSWLYLEMAASISAPI